MNEAHFPVHLFPSVDWFFEVQRYESKPVVLEIHANWLKQSPLSRFEIAGPNKRQKLIVPTIKRSRKTVNDVEIDYSEDWQKQHIRSLEAAYNNSPFFDFYRDELIAIYARRPKNLADLCLDSIRWCSEKLNIDTVYEVSNDYSTPLIINKNDQQSYYQVFEGKNDFQSNLSVLDALFNLGSGAGDIIR